MDREVARKFLEDRARRSMLRIGGHEDDVDRLENILSECRADERTRAFKKAGLVL
jgi:hypothetical protein